MGYGILVQRETDKGLGGHRTISSLKILMIGTFPIVKPQHGGQLRNRAIYDNYVSLGYDVRYCSVSIIGWYEDLGKDDIVIDITSQDVPLLDISPEMETGRLLYEDPKTKRRLTKLLEEFRPDVIQFEQPYTYVGMKKVLEEKKWNGSIIYSSHNIETELKRELLLSSESSPSTLKLRQKALNDVRQNEVDLLLRADLTITCTEADAAKLRELGANKTTVVANSAVKHAIDPTNLQEWKTRLHREGINKIILFVGSAHPPNLTGYKDLVGYGLGFLPRDAHLFIVGGVCDLLTHDLFYNIPPHVVTTFHLRATLLGRVDNKDLASLLRLADTIILPITQGGGSNLKTAEAILANKKVVATHVSFRSFDTHANNKNIRFADSSDEFKAAILESLQAKKQEDTKQHKLARTLTWEYALKGLAREVSRL